jgi:hypothetical protein
MNPQQVATSALADFPLLRSGVFSMKENMDGLIREIIHVFERCSKPESTFSDEERAANENLINRVLGRVLEVDNAILEAEAEGKMQKAMLLLFRKRLATSDNLEMLLRMVDADVQTGKVRCEASAILLRLVHDVDYVWSLKMKDGSYFATSYLVACCKALENETNKDDENRHTERSCSCAANVGVFAIRMTKDTPAKVIKRVHSFNWAQILSKATQFEDEPYKWFISLHDLCKEVLKKNADHSLAREFVRKLEMCHDFFRGGSGAPR